MRCLARIFTLAASLLLAAPVWAADATAFLPMQDPSVLTVTTTTDTLGNWTADISKAGCAAAPISVQVQAMSTDQTPASTAWANVTARTATAVTGSVTKPQTITLALLNLGGILPNVKAGAGVTVFLESICQ